MKTPNANTRHTIRRLLNGPQELGHGPVFWTCFAAVAVIALAYPTFGSAFGLSNLANFCLYVPMALGLALLWGYNGVLSFGQTAFFVIAGYVYGLVAGNLIDIPGGTLLGVAAGVSASALVAVIFGYFVFYGQVSGWIIPLLLLVLSLILETFLGQTAGYQWRLGSVLLGGYNGMTGIPSIQIGSITFVSASTALYYLVVVLTLMIYLGLRILVNSRYGHVIIAIRDNSERTRSLGYNVAVIQIQVFVLAAALAGLSGVLYVTWGNYINPASTGMLMATLPVIWTAVGGRKSLLAVLAATLVLRWLADTLAVKGGEYAFLIMGVLLLLTMVFFPEGIIMSLARGYRRWGLKAHGVIRARQ